MLLDIKTMKNPELFATPEEIETFMREYKTMESAYEEANEPFVNPIHEAVVFYWGKRCPEYDNDCPVCGAWRFYDKLMGGRDES